MHKITNINETTKTGICSICGPVKIKVREIRKSGRRRVECFALVKKHYKKYNASEKGEIQRRLVRRKRKGMNITREVLERFEKAEKCDCCGDPRPKSTNFHIDHCHSTGEVRGFLCNYCNLGLGFFRDSTIRLQQAISYLQKIPHVLPKKNMGFNWRNS